LYVAAKEGHERIIEYLLESGAKLLKDKSDVNEVYIAAEKRYCLSKAVSILH